MAPFNFVSSFWLLASYKRDLGNFCFLYRPIFYSGAKAGISGGSKEGAKNARPPLEVPILSISCSFWEILAKSYVGTGVPPGGLEPHLGEILDLPLGMGVGVISPWIPHCK